jgi:hypothetical protein
MELTHLLELIKPLFTGLTQTQSTQNLETLAIMRGSMMLLSLTTTPQFLQLAQGMIFESGTPQLDKNF